MYKTPQKSTHIDYYTEVSIVMDSLVVAHVLQALGSCQTPSAACTDDQAMAPSCSARSAVKGSLPLGPDVTFLIEQSPENGEAFQ